MEYQCWQETVSHSMHDVAAELQEMVFCNQVHVHGADIMPLGQASLAIMYYNGLHLGMQFIKQIEVTVGAAVFPIAFCYKMSSGRYSLNH